MTGASSIVRRALLLYSVLVICANVLSWGVYLHGAGTVYKPLARDTRPFTAADDQFRDLTNYVELTRHLRNAAALLGQPRLPVYNYPAPGAFVYKILLHSVPNHTVRPYLVLLAVCSAIFAGLTWVALRKDWQTEQPAAIAIALTAVAGYPLLFTADRGNLEGVVWAFAAAGLWFVLRARYKAGAALIGLAASIKPFVGLFFLLLLAKRRGKEALLGGVVCAASVVGCLSIIGPNPWHAYVELKPAMKMYISRYVENVTPIDELRFEHSLLDGMKSVALTVEIGGLHPVDAAYELDRLRLQRGGWTTARTLAHIYPAVFVVALIAIVAAFYRLPTLNQLTALGVAVTLLPLNAREYTLLHLYVPFSAWLVYMTREVATANPTSRSKAMVWIAAIYALLFSPLTPLRLYNSLVKMLLLIALLILFAMVPMPSTYFDREAPAEP